MCALKLIPVVAVNVEFTRHAIAYDVILENVDATKHNHYHFVVAEDLQHKDLVCKSNYIHNNKVFFTPIHVTPQFYQAIKDKVIHNYEELVHELNSIYVEGDLVGYAIPLQ